MKPSKSARSSSPSSKSLKRKRPAQPIDFKLYIAGQTPRSLAALSNLKRICHDHLDGAYNIQIIDLIRNPQLAAGDQILAIPTLVRRLPTPIRKIIGDLSNTERVLVGLNLRERPSKPNGKARGASAD